MHMILFINFKTFVGGVEPVLVSSVQNEERGFHG